MEVRENIFLEDVELELESYINKKVSFLETYLHIPMTSNIPLTNFIQNLNLFPKVQPEGE